MIIMTVAFEAKSDLAKRKTMKLLHRLLLVCTLPFLWASCVRDTAMDAMEEPQIVVECILTDEPVQTLYLTYTKGASREKAPDLQEATAVLTDLTDNKEAGRFLRSSDGSWQLSYTPVPEHRYRLDITVPGREPVWAEQTMPEAPGVDVRWDWWREDLPEDARYRKSQGYIFSADTLRSPVWFYGINYPDAESAGEMADRLSTDFPGVDRFNEMPELYLADDDNSFWRNWFRVSAYPDLEGSPYHRNYLRFPVWEGERTEFLVSGELRNYMADSRDFIHSDKRFAELHYFSASEDYDKFLTDSYYLILASGSSDLADIFLRENVYTNIRGGAVGLFGARVERCVLWDDDRLWGTGGPFSIPSLRDKNLLEQWYTKFLQEYVNQNHRPFSLLLYEVQNGYYIEESGAPWTGSTYYCIENEEQMREHGMEEYGPVDFSTKRVLLCEVHSRGYCLPFFVDWQVREDEEELGRRFGNFIVGILAQQLNLQLEGHFGDFSHIIILRIAVVVDRFEENALEESEISHTPLQVVRDDFYLEGLLLNLWGIKL